MKALILIFIVVSCLFVVQCSEDCTDCPPENQPGKLVVKSNPSGARIYLQGIDTGKNTPDSIMNLTEGNYDVFLYLQYYDTLSFTAAIYENATTTKEFDLEDGLPFVEILLDYLTYFGGDSVRFSMELNQDVLMDSVVVRRPIDSSGTYEYITFLYNKELLISHDQFGSSIKHYLPPPDSEFQYLARFRDYDYFFYIYGQKAYGAKAYFYLSFSIGI